MHLPLRARRDRVAVADDLPDTVDLPAPRTESAPEPRAGAPCPYAAGAVNSTDGLSADANQGADPLAAANEPDDAGFIASIDRLDDLIDQWWERLRGNAVLDRVFYTASEAADFSLLWHTIGVAKAIVRDDPRIAAELSIALGIESALVNGPVKSLFKRRRPHEERPRPHNLRRPRTSSFPSGHASAAMVAAALLSRRSRFGAVWYGLAVVVGVSRAHVRIHHVSDIVGGLVLGGVLGGLARRVLARSRAVN